MQLEKKWKKMVLSLTKKQNKTYHKRYIIYKYNLQDIIRTVERWAELYFLLFFYTIFFLFKNFLLPLQLEKTSRVKLSLDSFLVITKPASLKQCNVRVECLPAHVLETWALGSYGYR